jgi:acyl carrier protein
MLEARIRNVMGAVFGVDPTSIDEDVSPASMKQWDSMRHMNLVLALEDEFAIRFSDEQVVEMMSFKLIQIAISKLLLQSQPLIIAQ